MRPRKVTILIYPHIVSLPPSSTEFIHKSLPSKGRLKGPLRNPRTIQNESVERVSSTGLRRRREQAINIRKGGDGKAEGSSTGLTRGRSMGFPQKYRIRGFLIESSPLNPYPSLCDLSTQVWSTCPLAGIYIQLTVSERCATYSSFGIMVNP